jgi:hypothetical protein
MSFEPIDPLKYSEPFRECIILLNTFVETGIKLKGEYMTYLHTFKYSPLIDKYKRRLETIYCRLMAEKVINHCPELKQYILEVHDYVSRLVQKIDNSMNRG